MAAPENVLHVIVQRKGCRSKRWLFLNMNGADDRKASCLRHLLQHSQKSFNATYTFPGFFRSIHKKEHLLRYVFLVLEVNFLQHSQKSLNAAENILGFYRSIL